MADEEVQIHVMKRGGMQSACGLPRAKIMAANIEREKITCIHCRGMREFFQLRPVVSEMIIEGPPKNPRYGKTKIKAKQRVC